MLVMERTYKTGLKNDVKVFSGVEVEHTPAYGLQTLFLARNDLTFDQIQECSSIIKCRSNLLWCKQKLYAQSLSTSTTSYKIYRTWILCNSRLSI